MKPSTTTFINTLLTYKAWAFDTMIFIYLFEENPKYLSFAKSAIELLEGRRIKAITSVVSLLETTSSKVLEGKTEKIREYRDFFKKERNLKTLEVDWAVAEKAAYFRRNYSLRTPDAIQLATANIHGARAFLTNDDIYRQIKDFPILFLKDFVKKKR